MIKTILKLIALIVLILFFITGLSWIKTSEEAKNFVISKRIYHNFGQFWEDAGFVMKNRKKIGPTMKGGVISPAFRERLMLIVTSVNNCSSCSNLHTKQALIAGLSIEETGMLLKGILDHSPDKEIPALVYAKRWANADAKSMAKAEQKIIKTYGKEVNEAIELVLRMIRLGNLLSNTKDYLLCRFSFGSWNPAETEVCILPL
jgi:AhpD family alkylhydroperoxidase